MVEVISEGDVKGSKDHQCFHCYRPIPKGELHRTQTCKYDDIYTLRFHHDCDKALDHYIKFHRLSVRDFDFEGFPPLADIISDFGERQIDLDMLRGRFPHVVCRMELGDQLNEIKWEKRRSKAA